jgi:hydrogenase maturation protease
MNTIHHLKQLLTQRPLIFLGIGSEIRGDDGWALRFINTLKKIAPPDVHCIWTATTPENFFAPIAKIAPRQIIICDAGDFKAHPGTYRLFNYNEIADDDIFFTHRTSMRLLSLMIEKRINCPIQVLLLQPENVEISFNLSLSVQQGLKNLINEITPLISMTSGTGRSSFKKTK